MFKPIVDVRARIYDLQHEDARLTYQQDGQTNAISYKPPRTQADWHAKRAATDAVLNDIGGVVTRVGDETIGEMWSLYDGQDVLNQIDSTFSANVRDHIDRAARRKADQPVHRAVRVIGGEGWRTSAGRAQ